MLEQVPLFKHGPDEHGLVSLWQDEPVLYSLHEQIYWFWESNTQIPWLEQFAKHAVKSPVYVCKVWILIGIEEYAFFEIKSWF